MQVTLKRGGFQDALLRSKERYVLSVCGYGAGKSYIGALKAILLSQVNAGCNGLIVSHDWSVLTSVIVPQLEEHLQNMGIAYDYQKAANILVLPWGKIFLKVGSKPIVGFTTAYAWLDEGALMPDSLWKDVLARVRDKAAVQSQIYITTTPDSMHGYVYKNFIESPLPNSKVIYGSTTENSHLHEDYVESLMSAYDHRMQQAFIHGQFVNFNSQPAYHAFDRKIHVVDRWDLMTPYGVYDMMAPEPNLPLVLSLDFGVEVATGVVMQRSSQGGGSKIRVLDEIWLQNSNTFECVEEFVRRWGDRGFTLVVHGDASGFSSGSSAATTDYDIVRKMCTNKFLAVNIDVPRANSKVVDRLNMVNSILHGSSKVQFRVHSRCKKLIRDLIHVSLTADGSRRLDKKKDTELTHVSDALGYGIQRMPSPLQEFNKLRSWS